jgi:membrane protein DedA with SNARE-associated domain
MRAAALPTGGSSLLEAGMEAFEHQLVAFLEQLFQTIGWAGVVIIMAVESANIPIPSEVTMPLAGWFLVEAEGKSAVYALLAGGFFGALGCTIGSVISYGLGAYGGRPFLERYGKYLLITHHDLEKADRWFERWGNKVAFFSRLLPIVRTFISLPAGVMRTNFPTFALYTFLGSFLWCAALAWGGFMFGARWEELRALMRPFDIPIALIILAAGAWYVYHHVKNFREASALAAKEAEAAD